MKKDFPIGIFDSGVGGLTIARAVVDLLPSESLIYFGDTVHLPYGDKSLQAIEGYVKRIADFLLARGVKLILIACNSASAVHEKLQDYLQDRVLLVNVVNPMVEFLSTRYHGNNVGLIGTKLTIDSEIYSHGLRRYNTTITLKALATPLLVPIIEEGFGDHRLMELALGEYLSHPALQHICALVLGCTHYPIVKHKIEHFYGGKVEVLDASGITAAEVKKTLEEYNLLSVGAAHHEFYLSDLTSNFVQKARTFFGENISIEKMDLF